MKLDTGKSNSYHEIIAFKAILHLKKKPIDPISNIVLSLYLRKFSISFHR